MRVYPYGAVEVNDLETWEIFKVNGYQLKRYLENAFDDEKEEFELGDPPSLDEVWREKGIMSS